MVVKVKDSQSQTKSEEAYMRSSDIIYEFLKELADEEEGVKFRRNELANRFIAKHPDCTVIHLGCGLDSRCERVKQKPEICYNYYWI